MLPCSVPMGLCRVVIMHHNANGLVCRSPYAVVDQFPHTPSMPPDANCIFCLLWPHDCLLSTSYICNLAAALRHRQFSLTLRVVVLRCKLPLLTRRRRSMAVDRRKSRKPVYLTVYTRRRHGTRGSTEHATHGSGAVRSDTARRSE